MLTPPGAGTINSCDPVVIMRSDDGGIEVLAEDRAYLLPSGSLHDLLFFGNRVGLTEDGLQVEGAVAWPGPDRRWINFAIGGVHYLLQRSRLVWVARGDIPVDRLCCTGAR